MKGLLCLLLLLTACDPDKPSPPPTVDAASETVDPYGDNEP